MKTSKSSFLRALGVIGLLGVLIILYYKKDHRLPIPANLVHPKQMKTFDPPTVLKESQPRISDDINSQWKAKREELLLIADEDQVSLDKLYAQSQEWIENNESSFYQVFKDEVLNAEDLNVTVALFLANTAMRYSKEADKIVTAILTKEIEEEEHLSDDHHNHGPQKKLNLLKIHVLSEMKENKKMIKPREVLISQLVHLASTSEDLALVRGSMEVLVSQGHQDKVLSASNLRDPEERFAFEDLL